MRVPLAAIAACAATAVAALGLPATAAARQPPPCTRSAGSGDREVIVPEGGMQRSALVHVAAGTPTGVRVPIVLILHGAGGTGPRMETYTGMSAVADRSGFLAVYPSAVVPHPFWNYFLDPNRPNDIKFISDLIDHLEATRCVDPTRVYVTGVSNGGGMTGLVGCMLASKVTAIAPVAGGYARLPQCEPSQPVSVMEMHGTADKTVPYNGQSKTGAGGAMRYVKEWVDRDDCAGDPVIRKLSSTVTRYDWVHCAEGIRVGHTRIAGGPHEWPGWPATKNPPRSGLSASWAIWRFFAHLHR